jgi:hypothetical protein
MGRPAAHNGLTTGFDPPSAHHRRKANQATPLLRFYIHGAPHRRIHEAVLRQYRKALWEAGREARIAAPIRNNIELSATFINPTSPDLDKSVDRVVPGPRRQVRAGIALLADDRQIAFVQGFGFDVPLAQRDRASVSEAEGRVFESPMELQSWNAKRGGPRHRFENGRQRKLWRSTRQRSANRED